MTPSHVIYIPMAILLGIFLGFILGARAGGGRDRERSRKRASRDLRVSGATGVDDDGPRRAGGRGPGGLGEHPAST